MRARALASCLFAVTAACGGMMSKPGSRVYVASNAPPPPPPPMPAEVAEQVAPAPTPTPTSTTAVAIATPTPTPPAIAAPAETPTGDTHAAYTPNPWIETERDRLSTFAADVDTAAYTYARRTLVGGSLPPAASVRVEEFVNAFKYRFGAPTDGPFAVVMDAAPSPFDARHHIVRVGVATSSKTNAQRAPMNLVFLVDVSGSMSSADKLGLAQESLRHLVRSLGPDDRVSLVTYAGSTEVVLASTSGADHRAILAGIDRLSAGGSTAMGSGLALAYEQALAKTSRHGQRRVIVLSDGDANVGPSSVDEMLKIIDAGVKQGVTLSTIGFGMGNYRADLMEQLGDRGNGNNYYVDSPAASEKLFTRDLVSMLEVAAKDVKLQVEFDPAVVARYRLLGYENRDIADADFRVDSVDAGEIGVGHQVTALYEVTLTAKARQTTPLGVVRIRHKAPDGDVATEARFPMKSGPAATFDSAPADLRFATAAAGFADALRGGEDAQRWSLATMAEVARATAGADPDRRELVELIERARALRGEPKATAVVAR